MLHSKMLNLKYDELKIQDYLLDEKLSINQKLSTLKWRISCEDFGENYRGGRTVVICPLCMSHRDGQRESFTQCEFILKKIEILGQYEEIFNDVIPTKTIKILTKIANIRKQVLNK